jgi:hypothetical protein
MCLDGLRDSSDNLEMDSTGRIFRNTCVRCERPALTFDDQGRALCSRHATIFIAVPRIEYNEEDDWWTIPVSVEASSSRS